MINIRVKWYGNDLTVESYSLYRMLKLPPKNYSQWVKYNIESVGKEYIDWFKYNTTYGERDRKRYLITLDFACFLCLSCKKEEGKNLRYELLRYKYDVITGKYDTGRYD